MWSIQEDIFELLSYESVCFNCFSYGLFQFHVNSHTLVGKLPHDINKTLTSLIIEGNDFLQFLLQKN
jgi:hypothetical protein